MVVESDLYNDSLGDPPVDTYEGLIRWDAEKIVEALGADGDAAMTFDPHSHPHAHPVERRLPTVDAGLDSGHARAHADVWLADVSVGYGDRPALEDVDLAVEAGSLLAVVGPNGAGKSTLLKLMAGLLRPWHGRVEVLGHPAGQQARRVAYVPQAELVDWGFPVTVNDVVMMGRYPALGRFRRPGADDRRAVDAALEQVGMADHASTQIGVAVRRPAPARVPRPGARRRARTCSSSTSRSPASTRRPQEDLMDILEAEARSGKTVVATTHDLACAAQRFQQVATRQPDDHRPRPVVADPRPGRPRPDVRRPPARPRRADRRPRRRPPPRRRAGRRAALPRGTGGGGRPHRDHPEP